MHDYATSVFPVLQVDPSVDKPEPAHQFMSSLDEKIHGHCTLLAFSRFAPLEVADPAFRACTRADSDPELYRDAPIGLQCIGRKNEEEAVIR